MLQRSETIVHLHPDIIYKLDDRGCFTYINDSVRSLGYEPKDLISRHFSHLIHPDDIDSVWREDVIRKSPGKSYTAGKHPKLFDERRTGRRITRDLQIRLIPKNFEAGGIRGHGVTASCRVIAVGSYHRRSRGQAMEFNGTLGIIQDLRDDGALHRSPEQYINYYHALAELSNDVFFIIATDGTIMFASPSIRRTLGYDAQELTGENIIDYVSDDDFKTAFSRYKSVSPHHPLLCSQCGILHRDGSWKTFEVKGRTVYDEQGAMMYIALLIHDITVRAEAEANLKSAHAALERCVAEKTSQIESLHNRFRIELENRARQDAIIIDTEEKYRNLVNSIDDIVLNIDSEGTILFANPAIHKLTGHDHRDVIGTSLIDYLHRDDIDSCLALLHRTQGEDDKRKLVERLCSANEFRMQRTDGSFIWVELRWRQVTDADGGVIGFRGIAHDITRRKRTEEEMLRESKIESLGILAAGIAHDYNNLLTAIMGNISLAKITISREDPNFIILSDAENASIMAKNLTQQLMAFSKGGTPVKKVTSIRNLLVDTAYFVLRGSQIRIVFNIEDFLWDAFIDRGQIGQVVNNIILNARQSMSGGGTINITALNEAIEEETALPLKRGSYLKIMIADQGRGIPADVLPRIFDPYFSTKETGSGLGLAISFSIVKKHEGCIAVESEEGIGTVFSIYLPASHQKEGERLSTANTKSASSGKILLMDDETIILDLGLKMLAHLGFEVVTAKNGTEALDLYRAAKESGAPFDAVILDLIIPGGAGADRAIEFIRSIDPGVKAIVTSGYPEDPVMLNYEQYGFAGALVKPFSIDDVDREIAKVLN